jgi:hypothetical protein
MGILDPAGRGGRPGQGNPSANGSVEATEGWEEASVQRLEGWRRRLATADRLKERLEVLRDFGLSDSEIARVFGRSGNTRSIRRWRQEGVAASREGERWEPIDNLCAIIGCLLADGTYEEEGVVAWLRSRQAELDYERPLDRLGKQDFESVLTAAEATLRPAVRETPGRLGPLAEAARRSVARPLATINDERGDRADSKTG